MNQGISAEEIGARIKAFRLGAGFSPEELAEKAGISRAALYRYESGQPSRIDTLIKICDLLKVSLPTLLGAGVEYIASPVSFFERMRQLEEKVDQITVLFGPVSYLLTTGAYDAVLPALLRESIPHNVENYEQSLKDVDSLVEILRARKRQYETRNPYIISLISGEELKQFVRLGLVGTLKPDGVDLEERRRVARIEVENIIRLLRDPPLGVQLGVIVDSMPGASLQLFTQSSRKSVAVSPYRLGTFANIRIGVATITSASDATELYQTVTNQLWSRSLKGEQAADYITRQVLE